MLLNAPPPPTAELACMLVPSLNLLGNFSLSLQVLMWKLDITTQNFSALCSLSFTLICVPCENAYKLLSSLKELGRL